MPSDPQVSVIVSTFERPEHLRRSLFSLSRQRGVEGCFEVIVADDGSADSTPDVVEQFAKTANFPLRFVTQQRRGFHPARCRNNGALNSRAPYLIFIDGDCILPAVHLLQHLRAAQPGFARTGDSYRLDAATSARIDDAAIVSGAFVEWVPKHELRRMRRRWIKELLYCTLRHSIKPKLMSGNLAVWRKDFELINGFDEQYVGWGCEDDDLGQRLRRAGVRIAPIFAFTQAYHLWHPPHPSFPAKWSEGANVAYLLRRDKPVRCIVGLSSHTASEAQHVTVGVVKAEPAPSDGKSAA